MENFAQPNKLDTLNLELAIDYNPRIGFMKFDDNGFVLYASQNIAKMLEINHDVLIGRNIRDCFTVEGKSLYAHIISYMNYFHFEAEFRTASNKKLICEFSGDNSKKDGTINCMVNNITELKKAKEELVLSLENTQSMLDSSMSFIWTIDKEFNLTACNRAFHENIEMLWGFRLEVGKTIIDERFPEELQTQWKYIFSDALSGNRHQFVDSGEYNGKMQHYFVTFNPIVDLVGNVTGVSCSSTDRTKLFETLDELKREVKQSKIIESQLISSQLNPHFMFNALNSIQYYILEEDSLKAVDFLSKFSTLIRRTLKNSTKKEIPVSDELDFLQLYLDLEKSRFTDRFEFHLELDEEINEALIPPMLLQPFIENSIVHGFNAQRDIPGEIRVSFSKEDEHVICVVEDNGIGRTNALKYAVKNNLSTHESMAMGLTSKRVSLLKEILDRPVDVKVIDLEDEDQNALGTKVVIKYPLVYDE